MIIVVSGKINNKVSSNKKIIFLESPCNIKNITDKENILVIDETVTINDDGYFKNKLINNIEVDDLDLDNNELNYLIDQISIDELIIMVDFKLIIMEKNQEKIKEISKFYNIDYVTLK